MSSMATALRIARTLVAAALAVGGYLLLVPEHVVDQKALAGLVVSHSAVPGVPAKAKLSEPVDPSKATFAATKRAARRDHDHTGLYVREWFVNTSAPPEVGMVLQVLPDVASARAVERDVVSQLPIEPQLSGFTPGPPRPMSIPGIPGAAGRSFVLTSPSSPAKGTAGYGYKTVFRFGRVVLSELVVTSATSDDPAPLLADSRAAYRLLQQREPGFSLVQRRFPTTSSIVYVIVAVVVVAAVAVVPEWMVRLMRRRRQRRIERAQQRERQQYLARGRRNVRRHGAPPWAQPKRR